MSLILVVDDEKSMRTLFEILLKREGHEVETAKSGEDALAMVAEKTYDLVITDLKMPRVTGLDVIKGVKKISPDTEVIVVTAYSTVETAISAMKLGAFNYLSKPFNNEEIKVVIEKALERRALAAENLRLQEALSEGQSFQRIVGNSESIRRVFQQVRQIAGTRITVLITGESGTGKELVARAIHFSSPRARKPFKVVSCGAIPENLMESELFGHVKGAFTGAVSDKKGIVEAASGGTLFLDEIGELSLLLQVKLLRVLQERNIKPVGALNDIDVDLRVVAATNRNLEEEVKAGRFREDLFFRLNVINLEVPPLRDRREDIPLLARYFLDKVSEELDRSIKGFSKEALHLMMEYRFPGNVRELENLVERALAFETGDWVSPESLPPRVLKALKEGGDAVVRDVESLDFTDDFSLEDYLERVERHHIKSSIRATDGSVTKAAKRLGLSFRSFRYKMSKYGIKR
jgi:two-component system, NtrC family, response regulator PilR